MALRTAVLNALWAVALSPLPQWLAQWLRTQQGRLALVLPLE